MTASVSHTQKRHHSLLSHRVFTYTFLLRTQMCPPEVLKVDVVNSNETKTFYWVNDLFNKMIQCYVLNSHQPKNVHVRLSGDCKLTLEVSANMHGCLSL